MGLSKKLTLLIFWGGPFEILKTKWQGILIRKNIDFNEVDSTDYFFYFLIKIKYKYD
jgi:hypothetical protein